MDGENDIRQVVISRTFADIAGIPFKEHDDLDPVALQKLEQRITQFFGETDFDVMIPELIRVKSGGFRFPRFEIMAMIFNRPRLVVIFVDSITENLEEPINAAIKELDAPSNND